MDKQLLHPQELCIALEQPDSASGFYFWLRTVEDIIIDLEERQRDGHPDINTKCIIINRLSPAATLTSRKQRHTIGTFKF